MASPREDPAPSVTVAMVVRRPDPAAFEAAVASVLAQTLHDLELVVVETVSEQEAGSVLRRFADGRIRHLVVPAQTPLPRARNAAWATARADKIAILDADDVAEPRRLAEQVRYLDAHPAVGVLGSAVVLVRADGSVIGVRRYPESEAAVRRAMRRWNPIAQPAAMVRRQAFDAVGGYAEREGGVCEDYDLWCRMARAGVRFANLPEPLTRYRIHDGSMKSMHLRGTLRDTVAIKRAHFAGELDAGDRLRIAGERVLARLPAGFVRWLFLRCVVTGER